MASHKSAALIAMLDTEAHALLKSVKGNTITGVAEGGEHKARLDTFMAVVSYLAVRSRFVKEQTEESDLERLIRDLNTDADGSDREAVCS